MHHVTNMSVLQMCLCVFRLLLFNTSVWACLSEVSHEEAQWVEDLERVLEMGSGLWLFLFLMSREVSGTHGHSLLLVE